MISEEYKKLNVLLHNQNKGYGDGRPDKWGEVALDLINKYNAKSFLDYGCGKGNLVKHLENITNLIVNGYDPCVPEFDNSPEPADIIFCVDVLEHIEEDKIQSVLEHILSLIKKAFFAHVTLTPSNKVLPDGRNAHILLKPEKYWDEMFTNIFNNYTKIISNNGKHIRYLYENIR